MQTQYRCNNPLRREKLIHQSALNGIDFLEVSSQDQTKLAVHFLHNLPGQASPVPPAGAALTTANVLIEGGVRIVGIQVLSVAAAGNVLTVTVNAAGDFSTYTLSLITSSTQPDPPPGFDVQFSSVDFSFKAECPSAFDCQPSNVCAPVAPAEPAINYLAKDYDSFSRLMLDRLTVTMPQWTERNPADLGIALVETLANAADYLSYCQDAVATEAYLGTARRRTSVRRHARLLDYRMSDGSNARAWVALQVTAASSADGFTLPSATPLLTKVAAPSGTLAPANVDDAIRAGAQVFETMHDLPLYAVNNQPHFYTWGNEQCCLPKGATHATLADAPLNRLLLMPGDVLIFEERLGPATGDPADADPAHRCAVRLTSVTPQAVLSGGINRTPGAPLADQLTGQLIVEIEWAAADALPFPLCLSSVQGLQAIPDVSLAQGNVVLADYGQTIAGELLAPVPLTGAYRPQLSSGPLTQQARVQNQKGDWVTVDLAAPATSAFVWDMSNVLPAVQVSGEGETWLPQHDLLESSRFSPDFVVESEDDGTATLRFGDNLLGKQPAGGTAMTATYRIGNGSAGNVGPEAIAYLVSTTKGITGVRNPLPAAGGVDPETLDQVRLYAPQAFRVQARAVTVDDYAAVAQRHPQISKATATLRWTGSWYTIFLTVERKDAGPVDDTFKTQVRNFLEQFRLAEYDLEVEAPIFVPLDIGITVCVAPGYFPADVEAALLETFSNADLPGGRRGFFHPDNFTFGQPVYVSQVVAAAMQVAGVRWVSVDRFQRWGQLPKGELAAGQIAIERLEIARLDNDPNEAENGKIEFARM
jgi:hypothetical protein